jgi:cyclopropane-fatty-acyl-phospholipid synthase
MDTSAELADAPLVLMPSNASVVTRGYPYPARKALGLVSHLQVGRLDIAMPDGRRLRVEGSRPGPAALLKVHDIHFARRLAGGGDIGMAEAFLAGQWETPDLTLFLELFCLNRDMLFGVLGARPVARLLQLIGHWLNRNSKAGSRRNIFAHYDLGNAFYASWLDRTMTYSSALFSDAAADLSAAQVAKYRHLAETVAIAPDHRVLEIGCGWGGFAEYLARTVGCRVTGLTISPGQYAFARQRIFEAGLNEKVEIKLQDYRDERGHYDRIGSIEMFEAVGEAYWPRFFAQMRDRLVPDGIAGLQVITIRDNLFESYRNDIDFIRKYVFPGGMLPSPSKLLTLGTNHGFRLAAERAFGGDYARTLVLWRERFRAAWPALTTQGFDERFRRLWEYYLAYCEAGFRTEMIDVRQMVFSKTG